MAPALVLDWNTPGIDWPDPLPRDLSQGFDIDPSNPGNDITITIAEVGGTGFLQAHGSGNEPPNDVVFHTGGTPGNETLFLNVNFAEENGLDYLLFTITFPYALGVNNLVFSAFDVDSVTNGGQNFVDALTNFAGTTPSGGTVYPSLSGSASNAVSGSGSTVRVDGTGGNPDAAAGANVSINFGSNAVTQITFRYGSGNVVGAGADPTSQSIGLSAISFDAVVPEPQTWIAVLFLVFLAGATEWRRRSTARSAAAHGCGQFIEQRERLVK
ncbi:MAG: hypothetical protein SFU85_01760 [Candidatus Methylacidiphilales bacterium]|nr:hypothetical protein [Candidatus Methylacidiphilales bacterium]